MSREKLIEGLNEDLAAELGTVIRYTYQAAKAVLRKNSISGHAARGASR